MDSGYVSFYTTVLQTCLFFTQQYKGYTADSFLFKHCFPDPTRFTKYCGPDPFYTALIRIQKQLYGSSCISVSLPLILASRLSLSFYAPPMLDGTPSRR